MFTKEELARIQAALPDIRYHLKLSQTQAAKYLGITNNYFWRIEHNRRELSLSFAMGIAALCFAHAVREPEYFVLYAGWIPLNKLSETIATGRKT